TLKMQPDRCSLAQGRSTGIVAGPDGPAPVVGRTSNETSFVPDGSRAGSRSVPVDSSLSRYGIEPRFALPSFATTVPAQPWAPVPQLTFRLVPPSASRVSVVDVTANSDG